MVLSLETIIQAITWGCWDAPPWQPFLCWPDLAFGFCWLRQPAIWSLGSDHGIFQPSGLQLLANSYALCRPFQPGPSPRQSELIICTQPFLLGLWGLGCVMHFHLESVIWWKPRGHIIQKMEQGSEFERANERKKEEANVLAWPCLASSGEGRGRVASRLHQSGSEEEAVWGSSSCKAQGSCQLLEEVASCQGRLSLRWSEGDRKAQGPAPLVSNQGCRQWGLE